MFLLDTNVISELRKAGSGRADANVVSWANSVPVGSLFLSSITILELETGVLLIERKDALQGGTLRHWLHHSVIPAFENRVLSVDTAVALQCARLHVPVSRAGLIAATALVHSLTVVTRNLTDFHSTGVPLLNPWNPL